MFPCVELAVACVVAGYADIAGVILLCDRRRGRRCFGGILQGCEGLKCEIIRFQLVDKGLIETG